MQCISEAVLLQIELAVEDVITRQESSSCLVVGYASGFAGRVLA
jgi:hypothetical protein